MFVAGHWVPEMVELAGGQPLLVTKREKSRRVEPKDVAMSAPELAILMPCGYHLDRAVEEAAAVTTQTWWRDLPAARKGRVWAMDGSSYFNRPGPRLVNGLEILAHILHPEIFKQSPSARDAVLWRE